MRHLSLADLLLGLEDLFLRRRSALERTQHGRFYGPALEKRLPEIRALIHAESQQTGPQALDLSPLDTRHDAYGAAAFHLFEAHKRLLGSDLDQALLDRASIAERLQAQFVPELAILKLNYIDEAHNARARSRSLDAAWPELALFPVGNGEHVGHWLKAHFEAGIALAEAIRRRAETRGAAGGLSARPLATTLRAQTLGLLARLRQGMAEEMTEEPALPRDLELQVFGYFDELSQIRGRRTTVAPKGDEPTRSDDVLPRS